MIGVIDYGMGNLISVINALNYINAENCLIRNPKDLFKCKGAILPGVGSFNAAMKNLNELSLSPAIKDFVYEKSRPIVGICLGMQLLAERGMEHSDASEGTPGLGFLPGVVKRIDSKPGFRVPHIGFNNLNHSGDLLLEGIPSGSYFYFVHSYEFKQENSKNVIGTTDYGKEIVAAVKGTNVWGFQFHPEKSQTNGLKILSNFKKLVLGC